MQQPQFQLEAAKAHLVHINPRTEKHGEQDVPAADLKFQMTESNGILAMFHPTLRSHLYEKEDANEQLEGVEALTRLRFGSLITRIRIGYALKGADVVIGFGLGGGFGYQSRYRGRGWLQPGLAGRRLRGADVPRQGATHGRPDQAAVRGAGRRGGYHCDAGHRQARLAGPAHGRGVGR